VEIYFRVLPPPVFVEHLGDAVHDAIGAGFVGEEVIHGPGAPSHLPKGPPQKFEKFSPTAL